MQEHEQLKSKYLAKFRNTRKLGAQHFEGEFLEQLEAGHHQDVSEVIGWSSCGLRGYCCVVSTVTYYPRFLHHRKSHTTNYPAAIIIATTHPHSPPIHYAPHSYDEHIEMNRHKQLLSTMRTPIVLGGLAFGTHVIGMLFYLIGVSSFSVLLSYATWCCLLAIGFWFYSTYSGQFHEAAGEIDRVAKMLEDAAKSVLVTYYFGEGGKILAGPSSSGGADKTKAKKKN